MRRLIIIVAIAWVCSNVVPSRSLANENAGSDLSRAISLVHSGKIQAGMDLLFSELKKSIDEKMPTATFNIGAAITEVLFRLDDYSTADKVLKFLIRTEVTKANLHNYEWMQSALARVELGAGNLDKAEALLDALTRGDERAGYTPNQRRGLRLKSRLRLMKSDVKGSAFLMRRALISATTSQGASLDELVDTLTDYAYFLGQTRRMHEASELYRSLAGIYNQYYSPLSITSLKFFTELLIFNNQNGDFAVASAIIDHLTENIKLLDIKPNIVAGELEFQQLYRGARSSSDEEREETKQKIRGIVTSVELDKMSDWTKVAFAYLLLISRDIDAAQHVVASISDAQLPEQITHGYRLALRSVIEAEKANFPKAFSYLNQAIHSMEKFRADFELEAVGSLPALTFEERAVLGRALTLLAPVAQAGEIETIFQLQQFLSRDKSGIGFDINTRLSSITSQIDREEARSETQLRIDISDIIRSVVEKSVNFILAGQPGVVADVSLRTRLDGHEDRVARLRDARPPQSTMQVSFRDVQRLLRPDEAFLTHSVTIDGSLIVSCFRDTRVSIGWHRPDRTPRQVLMDDLKLVILAVRGLHAPSRELDSDFPVVSANRVYDSLFGTVQECFATASKLTLAPDPDLLLLPWNALVVDLPSEPLPHVHKRTRWLGREFALSFVPSVRAFMGLRSNTSRKSMAKTEFFGIGNPTFRKEAPKLTSTGPSRPIFVSRGADITASIQSLSPLPDTEKELVEIASALGSAASVVLLRERATERAVRRRDLSEFRVLSFATHALVAGEIAGIDEPAIVLTPGDEPDILKNDGLLTASEISALQLDADLVVLSACNTAAGDIKRGGRGLSGLADSFLAAGARSIAVTQWSVISESAAKIGAELVLEQTHRRSGSPSESLRRAIHSYIENAQHDHLAHPRFWGAYMIAGDGEQSPEVQPVAIPLEPALNIKTLVSGAASSQREFRGVIQSPSDQSVILLGSYLGVGEKVFSSFLSKEMPDGRIVDSRVLEFSGIEIAAGGDYFIVGGYKPGESAIFQAYDHQLNPKWVVSEQSTNSIFPVGAAFVNGEWIVSTIEYNEKQNSGALLSITKIGAAGEIKSRKKIPIASSLGFSSLPTFAVSSGKLVITFATRRTEMRSEPNARVGAFLTCGFNTINKVMSISIDDLEVRDHFETELQIVRTKDIDGLLYFLARKFHCGTYSLSFGRLDGRDLTSLYNREAVSDLDPKDFARFDDGWIIAGGMNVHMPFMAGTKPKSITTLDFTSDDLWDVLETQTAGVLILIDKDGREMTNALSSDSTYRSIRRVLPTSGKSGLVVGSAYGDTAWRAEIEGRPEAGTSQNTMGAGSPSGVDRWVIG
jgi:CHAT domain-containing protein